MRRREGRLLDLCEVVLGVFVEDEFSKLAEREVLLGPDLGQVKDVVTEFLSLLRRHSLLRCGVVSNPMNWSIESCNAYDVGCPTRVLAILDILEEALDCMVRVRAGKFSSRLVIQDLESVVGLEMNLGVNVASILLDVFEGVTGVPMHVVVPIWSSTVGEEDHDLMDGLWILRQVIL